MGDTIKGLFGIKTSAQKRAEAEAKAAQVREGRGAEQDAVKLALDQAAADRIARAAGQRVLAFQGNEAGLSSTLGGG